MPRQDLYGKKAILKTTGGEVTAFGFKAGETVEIVKNDLSGHRGRIKFISTRNGGSGYADLNDLCIINEPVKENGGNSAHIKFTIDGTVIEGSGTEVIKFAEQIQELDRKQKGIDEKHVQEVAELKAEIAKLKQEITDLKKPKMLGALARIKYIGYDHCLQGFSAGDLVQIVEVDYGSKFMYKVMKRDSTGFERTGWAKGVQLRF